VEDYRPWEEQDNLKAVRKYGGLVLRRWYLVAGSLLIALFAAWLINRYETPLYQINAAIITKKFEEDRSAGLLSGLPYGASYFTQRIEVFQEIPLLKSNDKIEQALRLLDFDVSYFAEGEIKTSEIYGDMFFQVEVDSSSRTVPYGMPIYLDNYDELGFGLWSPTESWQKHFEDHRYYFGQWSEAGGFRFRISHRGALRSPLTARYFFVVNQPRSLLADYRNRLQITWRQQGSAILNLTMRSDLPHKDVEFVRRYIDVVIEKGLEEKNEYATNTIHFINEQMSQISDSLMRFQQRIDNYKLDHRDLIGGSSFILEKLSEIDRQKAEYTLANRYYDYLETYIRQNRAELVFAPNLIGLNAPLLDGFVENYISSKMEDGVDLNPYNEKNPLVVRKDGQMQRLEDNIYENIAELRKGNREMMGELDNKADFFVSSMREFQQGASELMQLQRMYSLNENLFNLLLQKRTEASIARASTTSDYQIVEEPDYSAKPIYPNKEKIYTTAIALGLGLPIALIILFNVLGTKITAREELQRYTSMPLVGYIGHKRFPNELIVKGKPRSLVAEAFRNVRANLKYFVKGGQEEQRTYLITSSIVGEGKTFCSINLAFVFAMSGKKTLVIGADMRKPAMTGYLGLGEHKGLSDHLAGLVSLKDIIQDTDDPMLKVIASGTVPPNPSELLGSEKAVKMFESLKKQFDVIIIDTPPIGLVSDAMELLKFTDTNLLIVRQSVTYKAALQSVDEMFREGKIRNFVVVFNDVNFNKLNYGYGRYSYGGYGGYRGYGYGYRSYGQGDDYFDEEEQGRSLWARLLGQKKT
jgi:capsular exopolysaccharide synthesis family protein